MPSVICCLTVDVASFCAAVDVAADADDAIRVNVIAVAEKNSDVFCIIFSPYGLFLRCFIFPVSFTFMLKGILFTNNKKHLSTELTQKVERAIKNIVFVCNGMTQNMKV